MNELPIQTSICPVCHQPVTAEQYFCANCGTSLRAKQEPISLATQLGIYFISLFLPPLGFWPGVKYVMKPNPYAKRVGWVALGLTLLSSIVTTWFIFKLFDNYLNQLNTLLY